MKKLGFGCMRLPLLDKKDQTSFDVETFNSMVDTFLARGFEYFDTAYTYHGYKAETAVRESLVKRYDRKSFKLATKMPMRDFNSLEDMERIFTEQLENCGVEFFDYYLLHNIGVTSYKKACDFDSFGFCLGKKQEGRILNFGISFHDTPELLDEILTAHPELDFVQLQINYADWENPGIQSKRCLEVARRHGKPVVVMEPVKGGNLVNVPGIAENLMKEYAPNASVPSWAIRYAASKEGVFMVLSGMSTMDQLLDNTSYMDDFKPLSDEENEIIRKVTNIINEDTAIACTTCRYCEKDCPMNIAIPDYFALYNSASRSAMSNEILFYMNLATNHGRAKDCIACGQCESVCPQHLHIIDHLKDVSQKFDITFAFPTKK